MARTSTINIRRTSRGTTIRATGGAAQALCDAITGAATSVQEKVEAIVPVPIRLIIAARYADNTYHARPVASAEALAAGLKNLKATATSGEVQAIRALLAKASPPLRLSVVFRVNYGNGQDDPRLYTIEAEVA